MTRSINGGKTTLLKPGRRSQGYNKVSMVDEDHSDVGEQKSRSERNTMDETIPNYEESNPISSLLKSSSTLLPFLVLLVLKLLYDASIELFLCIALFITCYKINGLFLEITGFRKNMQNVIRAAQLAGFLLFNILFILLVYSDEKILRIFVFMKPNIDLDIYYVVFYVTLIDFLIKLGTMLAKCGIYLIPSRIFPHAFEDKGWVYLSVELASQLYRTIVPFGLWVHMLVQMHGTSEYIYNIILIIVATAFKLLQLKSIGEKVIELFKSFGKETYQAMPVQPSTATCPICQCHYTNPVLTGSCMHTFCNKCLSSWCNRDRKCPICKEELVNMESIDYRDGYTGQYLQLF